MIFFTVYHCFTTVLSCFEAVLRLFCGVREPSLKVLHLLYCSFCLCQCTWSLCLVSFTSKCLRPVVTVSTPPACVPACLRACVSAWLPACLLGWLAACLPCCLARSSGSCCRFRLVHAPLVHPTCSCYPVADSVRPTVDPFPSLLSHDGCRDLLAPNCCLTDRPLCVFVFQPQSPTAPTAHARSSSRSRPRR